MQNILNEFNDLIKENEQNILIPLFVNDYIILINKKNEKIKIEAKKELYEKRKELQLLNKVITSNNGIGNYYLYIVKNKFCILKEIEGGNFARLSECRKLNLFNLIKLVRNGK